jgi:chromosome partitioning protein
MHTIALATQKGGTGKSTLATSLAVAARQAGHTVRLIETDPLGTLSNWQKRRGYAEPFVETVYNARDIEARLQALEHRGVTVAIVDTPSGVSAASTAAIRHCDLCMIPARPSIADIEASALTLGVARAWKKPFAFILNQTPIRGQRIDNAATTLDEEGTLDMIDVVARPFVVMRNDHQDALAAGLAVGEFDPKGKSAGEVRALWRWIEQRLNAGLSATEECRDEPAPVEFPILLRKPVEIALPAPVVRAPLARNDVRTPWGAAV